MLQSNEWPQSERANTGDETKTGELVLYLPFFILRIIIMHPASIPHNYPGMQNCRITEDHKHIHIVTMYYISLNNIN